MQEKWYLENTGNINQMLRLREDTSLADTTKEFPHLVLIKHNFHIADDIMFPDPACLAFFKAFEEEHLNLLEEDKELVLQAVNICEGLMEFYVYSNDPQKTIYD